MNKCYVCILLHMTHYITFNCSGGHKQDQIFNSFMALWPALKSGGLYFIEDLQPNRKYPVYFFRDDNKKDVTMQDYLYYWQGKLFSMYFNSTRECIFKQHGGRIWIFELMSCVVIIYYIHLTEYLITHGDLPTASSVVKETPIPKGISWILCQRQACVIAKCDDTGMAFCT
jgi:hypothetical protein